MCLSSLETPLHFLFPYLGILSECNSVLIETHLINIEYAMYGRLVPDDGSEENCPHGKPHNNVTNCAAANRLVFTFYIAQYRRKCRLQFFKLIFAPYG